MADAVAQAKKQKLKARAEKAAALEYKPKRPLSRNGWFALALCPICIIAGILVFWAIAAFM